MKQFIYPIFLLFISIVLPTENFAQSSKEIIESGKGCGKIQLGKSLSEIKPILGEGKFGRFANWVEYQKAGLLLELLPSSEKIWSIFFVVNPKIWGDETYTPFQGSMPKNVSLQTSPEQLFSLFGKPLEEITPNSNVKRYAYDGIEYSYLEGQLMCIKVFNATVSTKNNGKAANITLEKGSIADCKYILSERCRGYFLLSNIDEIRKDIELGPNYNRYSHFQHYFGKGIELTVEPSTGRVMNVEIDKWQKKWNPDKTIKWDEDRIKVKKKLGEGEDDKYVSYPVSDIIIYPAYTLEFRARNLNRIYIKTNLPMTAAEVTARAARVVEDKKVEATLDSINKRDVAKKIAYDNSPAGRAEKQKKMDEDFKYLLGQLELKNEEGMRIIKSNMTLIAMGGQWANDVQKKIDKVTAAGDNLIKRFEEKYLGMLTQEMANEIKGKWRPASL